MKVILLLIIAGLTAGLIFKEHRGAGIVSGAADGCVHCHRKVGDPDPSHPVTIFGCHRCHLGNPYSLDKDRGHLTMVKNPGDLSVADRTCGQPQCHPEIVARVKNSIMATNRGILKTLEARWEGIDNSKRGVEDLPAVEGSHGIAIDQYRKMCGGCHLWKKRGDSSDEIDRRGGGCSDCHVVEKEKRTAADMADFQHAELTTRIAPENCTKCHNRSARIGLSYFGNYESEGYGTPYDGWELNRRTLSGERFYLDLPADIHHSKAGLTCIDCHTQAEIMGDGGRYERMKDQLEITCAACHSPRFSAVKTPDSLAGKLASLNRKIPDPLGAEIGISNKSGPLYNLQKRDGRITFYRKMDGKAIDLPESCGEAKPHHRLPGHERLSCQACHSAWIPQCYGCHIEYRKDLLQEDWLSGKNTPGRFREFRSHIRFSKPTLGVDPSGKVVPTSPCEVSVSVFSKEEDRARGKTFRNSTMSSFDPHTTQKNSRSCPDCHGDPKTLGFGEGILSASRGTWRFRPTYVPGAAGMDIAFAHDAFVDPQGVPLQSLTAGSARPFHREELDAILALNACLPCHDGYEDPIYRDFKLAKRRFEVEKDLPCRQPARPYGP